jgi:hypothetical protein
MQDMMKPNLNDIKALIDQVERLQQEVEQLKEKSFLTPVQSEAIKAGTDTALYILRLRDTNEEECWSNFGSVDSYFTLTGSLTRGRFAQNFRLPSAVDYGPEEPERIEWYNPNKHTGLFVRYDFDKKELWNYLNQYKSEQRQLYWEKHIQPLIDQLDIDLTPWLPFMKPYIDTERIREAIETAKPVMLSNTIHELTKIQKVVETESKQAPAGTEQAETPTETQQEIKATVTDLTVEDIDALLELFRQLESACKPNLPAKLSGLWQQCVEKGRNEVFKERQEDLFRQLRDASKSELSPSKKKRLWHECGKRAKDEVFGQHPPKAAEKAKAGATMTSEDDEEKIPQRTIWRQSFGSRVFWWAEVYYWREDSKYYQAVLKADGRIKQLIKAIDHALYSLHEQLFGFSRAKETLLGRNWQHVAVDSFVDESMQFRPAAKRLIKGTIDALEAIRAKVERQQQGLQPAETGKKDEPCDPLSWIYEMYDSLVWKEFRGSGERWVGPFDPILRFHEDTESLTDILTLKDCIAHLKKILPYWVEYQFVSPKSDILAEMTHTIRCWLIKVRHNSNEKLAPIPPDLIGMVDWIPDVEEILAGGTTRKEIDYTAQDRAEIARGPTVEPPMPGETGEKTEPVKEPPEEAENVFKKAGDYWTVRYQGENIPPLKDLEGMSYIAELLANPHKEIEALELVRRVKNLTGETPGASVGQHELGESDTAIKGKGISPEDANKVMDKRYLRECCEKLAELKADLERAKKDRDLAEEDRIQKDIDKLQNALGSATGLGGLGRQFSDDAGKARDSIRKSIERAKENIKCKHGALWQHLENTIKVGLTCSYKPDPEMNWQL